LRRPGRLFSFRGSMRFLVTGASGFAGGAVADRVLAEGDDLAVFARDAERVSDLAEAGAEVHVGTVGDPNAVARAARGCDVVVHAAAVRSHRSARRALDWINVAGTENVIRAARHAGCERVVHVSCADVTLGNEDRVNWDEKRYLSKPPLDAHARSKLLAEELALAANGPGVEVTAVRPALLWGPGDHSALPELVREGRSAGLRLFGPGANLLSTTYIDNLVDAILAAAEVEAAAGRSYYVTDGEFMDAREFFEQLSRAVGLPPPRSGPPFWLAYAAAWVRARTGGAGPHPTDVVHRGRGSYFDHQSAVAELEWEPLYSVAEGMAQLAAWVGEVGGLDGVEALYRPPADASSVDAEVEAAGGDG